MRIFAPRNSRQKWHRTHSSYTELYSEEAVESAIAKLAANNKTNKEFGGKSDDDWGSVDKSGGNDEDDDW